MTLELGRRPAKRLFPGGALKWARQICRAVLRFSSGLVIKKTTLTTDKTTSTAGNTPAVSRAPRGFAAGKRMLFLHVVSVVSNSTRMMVE
jgi:hypothetical protein